MAAPSTVIKTGTMGTITLVSGATTLALTYDMADLVIEGLSPKLNEVNAHESRGVFRGLSYGNRTYPTLSFSAWFTNFAGEDDTPPGSMIEFLTGLGAYDGNASTLGTGRPMTIDIKLTIEGTDFGDTADETIVCHDVYCTFGFTEAIDGNKFSISGTVYGEVVTDNNSQVLTFDEIS